MIEKIKFSELHLKKMEPFDLFITFCGFEKRCLSVIKSISPDLMNKVLVFINSDTPRESRDNLEYISSIYKEKLDIKNIDIFNPIEIADSLAEHLNIICKSIPSPRILVDITSFTHEALLIFVALTKRLGIYSNVIYMYCNAAIYASESRDTSEKWLSRGIKEVRSVLGYAGEMVPSQETVLVMMVGYEYERAWQVIDTVSPEELIITYNDASGSTDQTNGDANYIHANLLKDIAAYYENPLQEIVPSNNPFVTAQKLDEIIAKIDDKKNVIISPMNNKLATVGAAIVALNNPRIQLCYAPAMYYNTSSYSVPGDICYMFTL